MTGLPSTWARLEGTPEPAIPNREDIHMTEGLPGKIMWFKYVQLHKVEVFKAVGWAVDADLGPIHGLRSILMRYTKACEDKPPMPTGQVRLRPVATRPVMRQGHRPVKRDC